MDLTVVTMVFDSDEPEAIAAVLAKYVVVARGAHGCQNIDLCASVSRPGRFVLIEKWESAASQRDHFDSSEMIEMADACRGLLTRAPDIDLLDPISAHDLR
jgi:quinol monooxygenase YgiN